MMASDPSSSGCGPVPLIQVAGVHDLAEARLLVDCGVRCLGIPLRLPVNREDLNTAQAAEIASACASWSVTCVLITYLDHAVELEALARELGVRYIQIHGHIGTAELADLRRRMPEVFLIKSLVVEADNEAELTRELTRCSPTVDAFITDTYNPNTGASGATGITHDWDVSRRLSLASPKPLILAGGLTPENVAAAIAHVGPAGVDVHSGVEGANGRKTRKRVQAFADAARAAFAEPRADE